MLVRLTHVLSFVAGLALVAVSAPAFAQEEEEANAVDPNQPKATAGGVYSLDTYPLSEVERTLLLPAGVMQIRGDIDIDMTEDQTFETWTLRLFGRYGLSDSMEFQAGLTNVATASTNENYSIQQEAAVDLPVYVAPNPSTATPAVIVDQRVSVTPYPGSPIQIQPMR